jgi:hypothetical protein
MGYNTTVLIMNDGIEDIRKNPEEFVKNLLERIAKGEGDIKCGKSGNVAYVMKTRDADEARLYFSQGNWIFELSDCSSVLVKAHRKELLPVLQQHLKEAKKKCKEFEVMLKQIELKQK